MTQPLRAAILDAAAAIDAARDRLGVLDAAAGDGDHGMTMAIGARNVRRRLEATPDGADPAALVREVALAMGQVGGAIGPLSAAALLAVAVELEAAGGGPPTPALLHRCADEAERAIAELGGARPGDKTILDALHPLVTALGEAAAGGATLTAAIGRAVEAAEAGAASTASMEARIGRASRLGARSVGEPDPGATSLAIVVRALAAGSSGGDGRGA